MFKDALVHSGLTTKEALLYDILLENGSLPVAEIMKRSKLKRGIIYKALYALEEKGLVSKFKKDKKLHFKPQHPYKLLEYLEGRVGEARNQQANLETVLPQLVSSFTLIEGTPGVRTFEGIEGIKEVYRDTLKEGKEIWAILQTTEVEPELYRWLTRTYVKQRAKQGIKAKVIASEDVKTPEYTRKDKVELRETRVVPKRKFPVGIEVDIYGNKVGFMAFRKGAQHLGIIIENILIAETMRALFQLAWERAGEYSKEG